MIPKKIHYCWFGGKPLNKLGKKCLKSWKKHFPDYEIIEWNESNFDLNCCQYVKEAYEAKKWAFVSDYVRYKVLYEQGGVYFDTDVEVIKSFGKYNFSIASLNIKIFFLYILLWGFFLLRYVSYKSCVRTMFWQILYLPKTVERISLRLN